MNVILRRTSGDGVGSRQAGTVKRPEPLRAEPLHAEPLHAEPLHAEPLRPEVGRRAAVRRDIATLLAVVLRLIDRHGAIVIHVTAVSHNEGTSTVARELAITAARSAWCKVALVDANPAAAALSGAIPGALPGIGLLDSPGEDAELPFTRCWFGEAELMEGVLTSPASPLPSVEAVRALFARLRRRFTLVIVDSPPVAAARHTAAFAAAADYVVLVVEAERTRMADVERARATLEQLGAQVLGVVLNKRRSWVPERLSRLIWGVAP